MKDLRELAKVLASFGSAVALACGATACARSKTDDSASSQAQALAASASASAAAAGTGAASGFGERNHAPPPMVFEACVGKNEGEPCTVTLHTRTLDGTCSAPPQGAADTRLLCRMHGPPFFGNRPHHGGVPGIADLPGPGVLAASGTPAAPPPAPAPAPAHS